MNATPVHPCDMGQSMIARLIRILALLAVFALPLGMNHAQAAPASGHQMAGMEHCADMPTGHSNHRGKAAPGACAMACSSALPALADAPQALPHVPVHDLVPPSKAAALRGRILEIATPPPRIA